MKLKSGAFSLVEIMFVVTIIGLLAIIVMPSFLKSREESTRKACGNNLLQIYNAKLRWALEAKKGGADGPVDADLFGSNSFIASNRFVPVAETIRLDPSMTRPPAQFPPTNCRDPSVEAFSANEQS